MWEHPFHCTVVEDGRHLLNCLVYISLNMVRAVRRQLVRRSLGENG
jgi:hypothetical protein